MKSTNIYKALLALATPFMFAACSSDEDVKNPNSPEQFEGMVLTIPNTPMQTRANENQEAFISNLTVIAYAHTNSAASNTAKPLAVKQYGQSAVGNYLDPSYDYKQIPVPLAKGDYHIYVLANITFDQTNLTLPANASDEEKANPFLTVSEKDLLTANLTVISSTDLKPFYNTSSPNDVVQALPMSCNYDEMRKTASTGLNTPGTDWPDGKVEINGATAVYADLTYAVAKLRYTVLNGNNPSLNMGTSPITISNYATTSLLTKTSSSTSTLNSTTGVALTGAKYDKKCPEYTTSTNMKEIEIDNLSTLEEKDNVWSYQGIAYLPESIFATGNDAPKTTITFGFTPSEFKTSMVIDDTSIKRGNYYDVLVYTSTKTIEFQVRVKAWDYTKKVTDLEED